MKEHGWRPIVGALLLVAAVSLPASMVPLERTATIGGNGGTRTQAPVSTPAPTRNPRHQPAGTPQPTPGPTPRNPGLALTPGPSLTVTQPDPAPRPLAGVATIAEMAFGTGQDRALGDTGRYTYVAIQDYEFARIPAMRALNPRSRVIAYEEAAITEGPASCQYDSHPSAGISYCVANQYHPEWFLLDSGGRRLTYADYPNYYMMDIGNPSYQQAWLAAVSSQLRRDGFDGVMMDDVNLAPGHGRNGQVATYTDTQYAQAAQSFVAAVSAGLRAAGLLVSANVGSSNPWDPVALRESVQMARNLSIYNHEFWMRWQQGTPLMSGAEWSTSIAMQEAIEATGTSWTAITYGSLGDTAAMRYARASFLLAWSGRTGSALFYRPDPDLVDPYAAEWTNDVGTPAGNRYAVGAGWRRQFTGGTVIVNPSAGASQTFALGGTYRMPDGSSASSITLGPTSALVLPNA